MEQLLDAITELVTLVSPGKIQAIASYIRKINARNLAQADIVNTPNAIQAIERLSNAWLSTEIASSELASMLMAASHAYTKTRSEQSIELVWTGPTTPVVAARRTEQALLQVINSASQTLFLTSFVAYDVSSIVKALNGVVDRGVQVSMLLESSLDYGGSISIDGIGKMMEVVPGARLYAWQDKAEQFSGGRVHAKIALADASSCFITSANLTGFAMEKNMEAGVLISGGRVPKALDEHLRALIELQIIVLV